jgi:hypothetical protein
VGSNWFMCVMAIVGGDGNLMMCAWRGLLLGTVATNVDVCILFLVNA